MRTNFDALTALRACVAELDPPLLKAALHDRIRGGLPGSSMSDGRGTGEPSLPGSGSLRADGDNPDVNLSLLDATDKALLAAAHRYDVLLDELATAALMLRKFQRDVLYRELIPATAPKSKEFVHSDLRAAADRFDAEHDLPIGTTWAREHGKAPPVKAPKIEWCLSCGRVKGHLCPVATGKKGPKDGVLCRWCIDHRDGDKWPPLEHVQAHAEGRPVRTKANR